MQVKLPLSLPYRTGKREKASELRGFGVPWAPQALPCLLCGLSKPTDRVTVSSGPCHCTQTPENLVDVVWGSARPSPTPHPLEVQSLQYAGVPAASKVGDLQAKLATAGAHALVLSALDEVAWLLNLRGNDVPYNPVFVAYAVVTKAAAMLYVDPRKVTPQVSRSHASRWRCMRSWLL